VDPGKFLLFATGGLADAAYLFIVAAGLSLVFGALRVINMAHGSLYMIAAIVSVVVADKLGASFGFLPALLVAVLVAAALGAVIETTVLKRVYGHDHLVQLLATYAVALIIGGAARLIFGPNYRTTSAPIQGSITILGYS
jgi:branched-subunit amino acid ABC-type transport system permease component